MDNLITTVITIIKVLVTSIGLLLAPLLQSLPPTIKSMESALQNSNLASQDNSLVNSQSTGSIQNPIGRYRDEHVTKKLRTLPKMQSKTDVTTANVSVKSGDSSVSAANVQKASKIVDQISLPTLKSVVGLSPASNIEIVLFSSAKTYGNALLKAGIDRNSIQAMISETGGMTVGTTIWIPLYNLEDQSDLANVLSHELFHACAASQSYEDQLPVWINEGTAWRIGLMAQQKVNPQKTSAEMAYYDNDVRKAAQKGTILSLDASEQDILKANYNVEYEDFMAVEQLTKTYGTATYKTFIENLKNQNISSDFKNSFHSSMSEFQRSFIASLGIDK